MERPRHEVKDQRDSAFPLDHDRSSRILLLSGERGTGKTTVLLSLIQLTEEKSGSLPEDVSKVLGDLSHRLVWLAPIDMEPLAEPTNLLAAILARFSEAARGRGGEERDVGGLLESRSESRDTLLQLQHLETNVALAWDGNLAARGGQLDPDNFAVEVMRTERARLALNRSLKLALDDLARKVFGKDGRDGVSNPLFVLPVDDFDLNPLRCLDLLRVLRMVSVPRLFTLVLGDVKVAEMLFNLKLSGDFARLAGRSGREDLLSLSAEDVRGLAGEVAANAIRKLLPPGQIIRLEHMAPAEALNYAPAPDKPTLHRVLAASPLRVDSRYQLAYRMANLAEFFQLDPLETRLPESAVKRAEQPAPVGPGAEIARSVYTGRWVLSNSPRRIADLWHELELHLSKTARETLVRGKLPRELAASYDHRARDRRRVRQSLPAQHRGRQPAAGSRAANLAPRHSQEPRWLLGIGYAGLYGEIEDGDGVRLRNPSQYGFRRATGNRAGQEREREECNLQDAGTSLSARRRLPHKRLVHSGPSRQAETSCRTR